ncbi:hypothetical protein BST96_02625 [Oceanicoccus sagamiensis]|uniref:Uncharacterized protein n=1 Tax=Oceanicoccus sagamiensis TaxID=716816 RepID=A0A1X9NGG9_9GAMM|nr:hypothetical protein BST96_02625 [Oceanicoccus sagamiensis]
MSLNTPVLIGFGQVVKRDISTAEQVLSPVALASQAALQAIDKEQELASQIDTLAVVRSMIDNRAEGQHPFGTSNNPPLSVANRIGAKPDRLIYGHVGGQSPQQLVNEMAEAIYAGDSQMALICGAEATGAMKMALRNQWPLDWSEQLDNQCEDKGVKRLTTDLERAHHINYPIHTYALFENAWRYKHSLTVEQHQALMAQMIASFSQVAANNPYAQFPIARDQDFLKTPSKDNFAVNTPYNKWLVAQDAVNQGAAVLMTSVGKAKSLGIAEDQWVYLHGYADAEDSHVSQRPDLSGSNAIKATTQHALAMADKTVEDIALLDLYSCFPIAVLAACDALGIDWQGEKPLTITGGLPCFGGAGNNYSLHAIAEMCERLVKAPGEFGLVSANGGFLSKQSVGVYSTTAVPHWQPASPDSAQQALDQQQTVEVLSHYNGEAIIESYCLIYAKGQPDTACVVARVENTQQRVLAKVASGDAQTLASLLPRQPEPIGRKVTIASEDKQCFFCFAGH